MEFKDLAHQPEAVRSMYASVAHRYDLLNNIMSLNQANYWRRFAASRCGLRPGGCGLDVACGTGLLALELARLAGSGGRVVGVDFCAEMLDRAWNNAEGASSGDGVRFMPGDAADLPFADGVFDCATIGFALRVMPDIGRTISEMIRVVKPGGRVVNLDLAKPDLPIFKQVHSLYLSRLVPLMGRLGVGFKGPYDYLPHSLQHFPHQSEIRDLFLRLGLADVRYYELAGGVVAVQVGTRPRPA